jgi:hypothetical protein
MSDESRIDRLQFEAEMDAHEVEALRLELRRLARRHGVELEVSVESAADRSPSG